MKVKVKRIVQGIVDVLKEWDSVNAVVLQQFAEKDIYDPNFSVTLDVFRTDAMPKAELRENAFQGAQYFEASKMKNKDRFLIEDLPVRISYKDTVRVDAIMDAVAREDWLSMERGTYLFHRIATGTVVWKRDAWMDGVLSGLDSLPASFWQTWYQSCRRRVDHLLGDLGAAVITEDVFYFRVSLSEFLRGVAEYLLCVNKVFEPGPRDISAALSVLDILPEGFEANWKSLLRNDSELPPDRKRDIAELLARSIYFLEP
ncbi:MAG: hypothetical protein MI717_09605 [Spirochaetales bacterium]|nr:hypothetical protein [Spirochaetales bacterium]